MSPEYKQVKAAKLPHMVAAIYFHPPQQFQQGSASRYYIPLSSIRLHKSENARRIYPMVKYPGLVITFREACRNVTWSSY